MIVLLTGLSYPLGFYLMEMTYLPASPNLIPVIEYHPPTHLPTFSSDTRLKQEIFYVDVAKVFGLENKDEPAKEDRSNFSSLSPDCLSLKSLAESQFLPSLVISITLIYTARF